MMSGPTMLCDGPLMSMREIIIASTTNAMRLIVTWVPLFVLSL
jgi:hypothetical protein